MHRATQADHGRAHAPWAHPCFAHEIKALTLACKSVQIRTDSGVLCRQGLGAVCLAAQPYAR